MCVKSPILAYYQTRVRTTPRSELLEIIADSPLSDTDREFLIDLIKGYSYKRLADKYSIAISTVSYRKRKLYEQMANYERLRPQTLSCLCKDTRT